MLRPTSALPFHCSPRGGAHNPPRWPVPDLARDLRTGAAYHHIDALVPGPVSHIAIQNPRSHLIVCNGDKNITPGLSPSSIALLPLGEDSSQSITTSREPADFFRRKSPAIGWRSGDVLTVRFTRKKKNSGRGSSLHRTRRSQSLGESGLGIRCRNKMAVTTPRMEWHGMALHGARNRRAFRPHPPTLLRRSTFSAALHSAPEWCDGDACRTRSSAWRTNDERRTTGDER